MTSIRVRIAPSPTGEDLHIGNAYTALINYAFAKKYGGKFLVRIEDTDRVRLVPQSEQRILSSLRWLGLTYDEGPDIGGPFSPYRQSERLPLYRQQAEKLVEKGYAYYCFCPPQRLEELRRQQREAGLPPKYDRKCLSLIRGETHRQLKANVPHVIRMKIPDGQTSFTDVIRGEIIIDNNNLDDQVLIKSDGFPTYHLAVVVDDHLMQTSHVIRGEDWISSTPKHVLLYQFFGWKLPVFAHLPLLRNPDKSKLSKRKNPVWVSWYKDQGFLPEPIINYLALMGWSHPEGKEIFSIEEFIKVFTLDRIQPVGPVFDVEKLRWLNGQYLRKVQSSKFKVQSYRFFKGRYPKDLFDKTIPLVQERMRTLKEYETLAGFFYQVPKDFERSVNKSWIKILSDTLAKTDWTKMKMEEAVRELAEKQKVKPRDLFMDLRLAITGKTVGPPLLESMEILGKEECLKRLGRAVMWGE